MKVYKAILHTIKTEKEVRELAKKENWVGHLSDEDINDMVAYNKEFDGAEVYITDAISDNGYNLVGWDKEDSLIDNKVKEAIYIMEQDRMFGNYRNDREEFENVWQTGEYESDAMIGFSNEDVEIIETVAE